jgi:tetratricopeptide (TPR) repeat protein
MCPLRLNPPVFLLGLGLFLLPALAAQGPIDREAMRAQRHTDIQWESVKQHMPNIATATPKTLEMEGDLLRARRFPEDALDFYNYALQRGGNSADLLNKIGLTQLELRNMSLAEDFFRHAVKSDRKNAQGWNNLAATEYLQRRYSAAVSDYKRAVKLDKSDAIYHLNLSTAYFEVKDYKNSRKEAAEALKLDPLVSQHGAGFGVTAHVLSVEDRARFAYEMAKLFAQQKREEDMLHSLAKASEDGFDILAAMAKDPDLSKYRTDPRVALLVMTAKTLRQGNTPVLTNTATLSPRKDGVLPPESNQR